MNTSKPEVSVIMSVYNGSKYLKIAIESILNQTFQDFEFIIINDNSNDNSNEIINTYNDSRIIYISNQKNLGIAHSRNIGINLSRGNVLAFFDQDDISINTRIESQLNFMNENPKISICGSRINVIDAQARLICTTKNRISDQSIKIGLLCGETSIANSSVVIRKQFLEHDNLSYDPHYHFAEDYDLWCRCFLTSQMANLYDPLISYRMHNESASHLYGRKQRIEARIILKKLLSTLQIKFSEEELICHYQLYLPMNEIISPDKLRLWINKLLLENKKSRWFSEELFEEDLSKRYTKIIEENMNIQTR